MLTTTTTEGARNPGHLLQGHLFGEGLVGLGFEEWWIAVEHLEWSSFLKMDFVLCEFF